MSKLGWYSNPWRQFTVRFGRYSFCGASDICVYVPRLSVCFRVGARSFFSVQLYFCMMSETKIFVAITTSSFRYSVSCHPEHQTTAHEPPLYSHYRLILEREGEGVKPSLRFTALVTAWKQVPVKVCPHWQFFLGIPDASPKKSWRCGRWPWVWYVILALPCIYSLWIKPF